jgi:hypothetical protein
MSLEKQTMTFAFWHIISRTHSQNYRYHLLFYWISDLCIKCKCQIQYIKLTAVKHNYAKHWVGTKVFYLQLLILKLVRFHDFN